MCYIKATLTPKLQSVSRRPCQLPSLPHLSSLIWPLNICCFTHTFPLHIQHPPISVVPPSDVEIISVRRSLVTQSISSGMIDHSKAAHTSQLLPLVLSLVEASNVLSLSLALIMTKTTLIHEVGEPPPPHFHSLTSLKP